LSKRLQYVVDIVFIGRDFHYNEELYSAVALLHLKIGPLALVLFWLDTIARTIVVFFADDGQLCSDSNGTSVTNVNER